MAGQSFFGACSAVEHRALILLTYIQTKVVMNNYCMLLVLKAPWYLNKKKYPLEIGYLFNEQVEQVDESPLINSKIKKNVFPYKFP